MAIVRNNPLLMGISGSIGKQITFRQLGGQTVLSKYRGPSSVPATDAQLSVRGRFAKAVAYARKVRTDESLASLYQAAASKGHSAYHLALRDALSAPSISQIKCNYTSGTITVKARDIVRVHSVILTIRNTEGIVLQEGPASWQPDTDHWTFRISTNPFRHKGVIVTAVARDYPGNSALCCVKLSNDISANAKAGAGKRYNKWQRMPANLKLDLRPAFIKSIEKRAREPDRIIKHHNHWSI